ncbi:sigma-G-dependent sporulation-specific acid-soluble spore protein CsgA [Mesobacillus foraminis]|jgi:hypothetical protein|uniref:Sporulation protein n=1 Tax=Mesobacillus foraminis TaxID=279826 RepID=A0A4R2BEP7_9BACI|nr:sigma-G-dependent sporulation-specific acid-soluble spore protein CsgA [Mesobacillus foraminis]TCN24943.1 hypothetical protein EV146_106144 [Mesobacillus foraminis]
MEKTLAYLRETLSNYTEKDPVSVTLMNMIENGNYSSEGALVRDLTFEQNDYLNKILQWEIEYAKNEQDEQRARQLNEVFELLF